MTEIVISFDTEDFTSSRAADAIRDEAEILRSLGIRGCFCIVGLLAKQLKAWGRDDVLAALKHHEIDFHTYGHSLHPTIDEYTDIADYETAKAELIRRETKGAELVKEIMGVDQLYSACPPGNQNTYVAMYAYEEMGIPLYAGTFCDTLRGDGVFYCNTYHMRYTYPIEKLCYNYSKEAEDALIEEFAKCKRVIFYTHPNIAIMKEFWDRINYFGKNHAKFGEWDYPDEHTTEEINEFYKRMRNVLERIKNDGRFKFTTYGEIYEGLKSLPPRIIRKSDIKSIRDSLKKKLFPIERFSLYDMLMAAGEFAKGKDEYVCGKSYGLLAAPHQLKTARKLSAEDVLEAVRNLEYGRFIPERIAIGDVFIGPADLLIAAYDALLGIEKITVLPKPQLPSLDILPDVRDAKVKGSWMRSEEFEDRYLSERLRLQSYTMHF